MLIIIFAKANKWIKCQFIKFFGRNRKHEIMIRRYWYVFRVVSYSESVLLRFPVFPSRTEFRAVLTDRAIIQINCAYFERDSSGSLQRQFRFSKRRGWVRISGKVRMYRGCACAGGWKRERRGGGGGWTGVMGWLGALSCTPDSTLLQLASLYI